jgi:hypothetical protein
MSYELKPQDASVRARKILSGADCREPSITKNPQIGVLAEV